MDVRILVDEHHVRAVADLRSDIEVGAEGPGPLTGEPRVYIVNLSLYPAAGHTTDAAATEDAATDDGAPEDGAPEDGGPEDGGPEDGGPVLLPWQASTRSYGQRRGAAAVYLGYLDARADSVLGALRLIAATDGATIVHCAAGKDRTGVVVAMTLAEIGVDRADIEADYAHSGERIEAIFARLAASPTYAEDVAGWDLDRHRPRAETMAEVLDAMKDRFGGPSAWLREHGWTDADATALRDALLD
jgi:hypothetical protein